LEFYFKTNKTTSTFGDPFDFSPNYKLIIHTRATRVRFPQSQKKKESRESWTPHPTINRRMRKPCAFASHPCACVRFGTNRSISPTTIERTPRFPRASLLRYSRLYLDHDRPRAKFRLVRERGHRHMRPNKPYAHRVHPPKHGHQPIQLNLPPTRAPHFYFVTCYTFIFRSLLFFGHFYFSLLFFCHMFRKHTF